MNSTLAAALVGAKLLIPVAHLEAGLRSGDRTMPEEINRIVTDSIADLLWTPSPDADEHLAREGVVADKVERVGNIMIDSFELLSPKIRAAHVAAKLGIGGAYGVVTLHRPANVDDRAQLDLIGTKLLAVAKETPLVFPVHPRTRHRLREFGLAARLEAVDSNVKLCEPLPYVEFMSLVLDCRFALTDSGGIQEETSYLGIPCLTLRENTERPATLTLGTNRLVKAESLDRDVGAPSSGAGAPAVQDPVVGWANCWARGRELGSARVALGKFVKPRAAKT